MSGKVHLGDIVPFTISYHEYDGVKYFDKFNRGKVVNIRDGKVVIYDRFKHVFCDEEEIHDMIDKYSEYKEYGTIAGEPVNDWRNPNIN